MSIFAWGVTVISHRYLTDSDIECLEAPGTDPCLLPPAWRRGDNSRRIAHSKIALRKAMKNCVTPAQHEQLILYYWQGLSKSEIARRQKIGCSAVTKSLRAGEEAVKAYVEMYLELYDALERELLRDEE